MHSWLRRDVRHRNGSRATGRLLGPWVLGALLVGVVPGSSGGQEAPTNPAALDTTIAAGESDAQVPPKARGLAKYNQFDLGFTTFRIGYGFLVDFATYSQDADAEQQVKAEPDVGLRDFRFMFKGKFKTKRNLSWTMGIMWDKGDEEWHFRQTGIMFDIPEISSDFFIGRTKEGYSQYKYMVGYDIWTIERSPFLELAYGYGHLDRFDREGVTQFFQGRFITGL